MQLMHRLTVLILVYVSMFSHASGDEIVEVVIYGDDNHPPYAYLDENGNAAGIYADILRTAFREMEDRYRVEIRGVPWKRGLTYMEKGKGFALYPPHFFPERRPYLWPYSMAILEEQPVVACRKAVLKDIERTRWPSDFLDLRFGISAGVKMGGDNFWRNVNNGRILINEFSSARENLQVMILGRTDCHINDRFTITWLLRDIVRRGLPENQLVGNSIQIVMPVSLEEHGFLAYSNVNQQAYPYKADFSLRLDRILYRMKRDGTIKKMVQQYLEP